MELDFDEAKRQRTLRERGLDFAEAVQVFLGPYLQLEDDRLDYGEPRYRVYGWLAGRRVVVVWTPRAGKRRIMSMRHAHEEEFGSFQRSLD